MSTVLITGASGGIGYELAMLFARDHHNLVLVARSGDKLGKVTAELQKLGLAIKTVSLDLADAHAPKFLFDQLQRENIAVDILINNAGFGARIRKKKFTVTVTCHKKKIFFCGKNQMLTNSEPCHLQAGPAGAREPSAA